MRYLGRRLLSECNLKRIEEITDYEVYVPKDYCIPVFYLRKGCPIWIRINESEYCDVFECTSKITKIDDISDFIRRYS